MLHLRGSAPAQSSGDESVPSGELRDPFLRKARPADLAIDEAEFRMMATDYSYFTDRRWVDEVPSMFSHVISRDVGRNVAYRNFHERSLSVEPDHSWSVNSEPVRFYHFSGHDDRGRLEFVVLRALFEPPELAGRVRPRAQNDLAPLAAHVAGVGWLVERHRNLTGTRVC